MYAADVPTEAERGHGVLWIGSHRHCEPPEGAGSCTCSLVLYLSYGVRRFFLVCLAGVLNALEA